MSDMTSFHPSSASLAGFVKAIEAIARREVDRLAEAQDAAGDGSPREEGAAVARLTAEIGALNKRLATVESILARDILERSTRRPAEGGKP
jgi:hypothetical protein